MTGADRLDTRRDTAALIRATADHDREAQRVILDYSDNRAVATYLARLTVAALPCLRPGIPQRTV